MSVVTSQARRRWGVVSIAVAVLACVPMVSSAASAWIGAQGDPQIPARELMDRARHSDTVGYSGLATSRGNLGLPDLPSAASAAAALGGTTRTRTWWASPADWRVSVLDPTGEQGIYYRPGRTYLWDYENNDLTRVDGDPELRLPRADDLAPPQATRRLLAGVSSTDTVSTIGERRIAGTQAQGVRITPSDSRSTIGRIDIWIEPDTGLPLSFTVIDIRGVTALESSFEQLDLTAPSASDLAIPRFPGISFHRSDAADLAARINRFGGTRLPDELAGFQTSAPIVGGTATYGTGLVRFVVLPVQRRDADTWMKAARNGANESRDLDGGEALLISTGSLNLVVAQAVESGRTYAIAGLVEPSILYDAVQQLFTHPPARRGFFS